jgi:DNA-binding NarL/FixJ family response regulator
MTSNHGVAVLPPRTRTIRLLVVDDSEAVRTLVRCVVELADVPMEVVAEAASAADAVAAWRQERPDVVLLDLQMPGGWGLDAAAEILGEHPEQRVILFSAVVDESISARAHALGVRACLAKSDVQALPAMIVAVAGDR